MPKMPQIFVMCRHPWISLFIIPFCNLNYLQVQCLCRHSIVTSDVLIFSSKRICCHSTAMISDDSIVLWYTPWHLLYSLSHSIPWSLHGSPVYFKECHHIQHNYILIFEQKLFCCPWKCCDDIYLIWQILIWRISHKWTTCCVDLYD